MGTHVGSCHLQQLLQPCPPRAMPSAQAAKVWHLQTAAVFSYRKATKRCRKIGLYVYVYIYIYTLGYIYIYIECTCDNVSTYIQLGYNRDSMGIKRRYNIPMGPLRRGYAGDFQKTISMTIASCRGLTRPYHWNILISWWPKCTLFDSNSNLCCSILGCFVCLNDFIFVFLVQFECLFDAVNPQFHLCSFWQFPNDVLTSEK